MNTLIHKELDFDDTIEHTYSNDHFSVWIWVLLHEIDQWKFLFVINNWVLNGLAE